MRRSGSALRSNRGCDWIPGELSTRIFVPFLPPPGFSVGRVMVAFAAGLGPALAGSAAEPRRSSEIIVSAANYAQSPPDVLARLFHHPQDLVDVRPPPAGQSPVHYYQFLPSETLAADLTYVEVCKLLLPVLTAKNFFNTTDKAKVDFILRVTFGERRWRDPMVREGDLAWRHGLVPERRSTAWGSAGVWDERAGGDELALHALERDLVAVSPGAEGMADSLIGNLPTDDFYLIVVDAFDVATLRRKGNDTPRAWTTFIAVPRRKGVKFSDVAAQMIAKAAPYFGETLPGKAHFTDREGTVRIDELKVIDDQDPAAAPKK